MYEVIVIKRDGTKEKVFESWSNSECYREMHYFEAHPIQDQKEVIVRVAA